ncbi:glutathione peroxidase [Bacillus atrophaeus]|uniref:Glutathione peroxidase n=2 Tax=Bacillus atrophaeus TaxID=1452 RepID=A0ABM5LXW4_BACA1|nr:glutathione peroxidase [Bacillus atrophaeus]AMR62499.1 glutathione peroxidase [Bacillus subtilis subsp. globigii]ADP32693.1 putative peroxidase [Bacillus atrophaeus 1942]AIK48009.1 glutathione peroxidase family protein [Bacillus atrophaeus subsp. globigii]AKL84857.1 BsaA [Bacillus atrophaeus UCMB-5137]ARW07188.1 Glutathione peroxidase [Bacillus atrophaeus]
MSIYDIEVRTITGEETTLQPFAGKVMIIVNTASKCGFTPQLKQLQELYDTYQQEGLEILGFPCNQFMNQEPGDETSIQEFCKKNYGVTFPMFAKIDVNGAKAHPLFTYLTEQAKGMLGTKAIKWNFTKFVVDKKGNIVGRYSPNTNPKEIEDTILKLLAE